MFKHIASAVLIAVGMGTAAAQAAPNTFTYEVTITNQTLAEAFTPLLAVTHNSAIQLFTPGEAASAPLAEMAEGGDIGPLRALAESAPSLVASTEATSGLLLPGKSVTLRIATRPGFDRLSLVGMLIPTNDTFLGVNSVELPRTPGEVTVMAVAYDAGSEPNDELCANMPGPTCGGVGSSPNAGGEGFVYVSNGIHGIGDLKAATYDWRNPVATVVIRRVGR
jgi:Spondin_N